MTTLFLSASAVDNVHAERLYYLLGSHYKVFHAPKEIAPGDSWQEAISQALKHSRSMLLLFSSASAARESKWISAEIRAAFARLEADPSFRLIPVQLDPHAQPRVDELNRYQWLRVDGGDMQDVALQIRRTLSTPAVADDDRDRERASRLTAELDQAVEQRAALGNQVEQLQQKLQDLSAEHAALTERAAILTREREDFRRSIQLEKSVRAIVASATVIIGIVLAVSLIILYRWFNG